MGKSPRRSSAAPWLLLIHQLPPSPAYLRVKVRRRLSRLGAIPLKNSVYGLPNNPTSLEDFEWLARDIIADGGDAIICAASILRAGADQGALMRAVAEEPAGIKPGRTWVTRRDVRIDRIASGWLIRRFIDPKARFKFVVEPYRPRPGELRFDMFQGEYGHEGKRCTFETLLARTKVRKPGLAAIGELVHDIDCKDERYGRPEAGGVATLIDGVVRTHRTDGERLKRGAALLDELYREFSSRAPRRRTRASL
jgi:hypothetical protein